MMKCYFGKREQVVSPRLNQVYRQTVLKLKRLHHTLSWLHRFRYGCSTASLNSGSLAVVPQSSI